MAFARHLLQVIFAFFAISLSVSRAEPAPATGSWTVVDDDWQLQFSISNGRAKAVIIRLEDGKKLPCREADMQPDGRIEIWCGGQDGIRKRKLSGIFPLLEFLAPGSHGGARFDLREDEKFQAAKLRQKRAIEEKRRKILAAQKAAAVMKKQAAAAAEKRKILANAIASGKAVEARLDPESKKLVQFGLIEKRLLRGIADGTFGPATRTAIANYQKSKGQFASGYLDAKSAKALKQLGRHTKESIAKRKREILATEAEIKRKAAAKARRAAEAHARHRAKEKARLAAEAEARRKADAKP